MFDLLFLIVAYSELQNKVSAYLDSAQIQFAQDYFYLIISNYCSAIQVLLFLFFLIQFIISSECTHQCKHKVRHQFLNFLITLYFLIIHQLIYFYH